jgi:hypothetical protein
MFVADAGGRVENVGEGAVSAWPAAVEFVRPTGVHVYTLDRGPALTSLRPASPRRLREIAEQVRAAGIRRGCTLADSSSPSTRPVAYLAREVAGD